tara:strand:- start:47 stop:664 length:618 start_codon:yes stop_codon:yes gene_type:complete
MTRLIIARHGNTFDATDTPTRVGARTDIPLVEKGREQARALGAALKEAALIPDNAYSSELSRTKETALIALNEMGLNLTPQAKTFLNEIDYGPDENKPEDEVIARIGKQAIENWDKNAEPPQGWDVNPKQIIADWKAFADNLATDSTTFVVTSNGIARFAPHITGEYEAFSHQHSIKLSTGAYGVLQRDKNGLWHATSWNIKPKV